MSKVNYNSSGRSRWARIIVTASPWVFAAAVVIWIFSYFIAPRVVISSVATDPQGNTYGQAEQVIGISKGIFGDRTESRGPWRSMGDWHLLSTQRSYHFALFATSPVFERTVLGFSCGGRGEKTGDYYNDIQFSLPLWFVCVLLVGAFAYARSTLRAWRAQHHLCEKCAYDLTGNASGVCPECGTAVQSRSSTK